MPNEYVGRVSSKAGKQLHVTGAHPSREAAARSAFEARPKAKSVSTCIAHEGKPSHRDIQFHRRDQIMKEGETVSCQPQTKGRNNVGRSKTVREGIAYLLEDIMEKSDVVRAAQGISDKLQDIAEDLSTVEAKEIMPMSDSLITAFGPEVANQFSSVATEQVRQLITAIQSSKMAIDQEIQRMKQGVEGGDMSDMSMDNMAPPQDAPVDAMAAQGSVPPAGLPDAPAEPAPDQGAVGGGFAGRARKESAKPRGKTLAEKEMKEDFLGNNQGSSPPAIDKHPHKSVNFATNLQNLGMFHGRAGKLARNIESMIDTDSLTGNERSALALVLSNFAGFAHEPSIWTDAESKLQMSLQSAGLWDTSKPEVNKIVTQLRKLAHMISLKHDEANESAIKRLTLSSDPDAMVLGVFRTKLSESKDAQTAAIHAARTFAIDIEDVVAIVREAAENRDRYGEKARADEISLPFFKKKSKILHQTGAKNPYGNADTNVGGSTYNYSGGVNRNATVKPDQWTRKWQMPVGEENEPSEDCKMCHGTGKLHGSRTMRGKEQMCPSCHGTGKAKEAVGVNEDELIKNGTFFPVQSGPNTTPNPPISNPGPSAQSTPPVGGPSTNPSTRSAQTPADMRAKQQTQTSGNQVASQPLATNGKPMMPPSESDQNAPVPPSTQPRMAPTNQVRQPSFNKFQRQQ